MRPRWRRRARPRKRCWRRCTSRDAVRIGRILGVLRPGLRPLQTGLAVVTLPLVLVGLAALLVVAPRRALFTLVVPLYQVAFQSIVHFELRYVLPMHACLLVLAGVALALAGGWIAQWRRRHRRAA